MALTVLRNLAFASVAGVIGAGIPAGGAALAEGLPIQGMPHDGGLGFTPAASPVMRDIVAFHDKLLLPIITAVTIVVLLLLLWVMIRYNSAANKEPRKFTHNTLVEIIWTVIPVAILVVIAVPSFKLLYKEDVLPKIDMTIKATGNQWYWSYEYPDNDGISFDSNLVKEADLKPGQMRLLSVDNPLYVPINKNIRVIVTATDVIHAFTVPAFGFKIDAVPGRLNEVWFKAEKPGIYFGQCSELCGKDHAFMPIEVHAMAQEDFDAWVASKKTASAAPAAPAAAAPGAAPAAAPAETGGASNKTR
ncbi:MAG: cytochrome c oxidase subunit II [Caulobacterales bacterium]